MKKTIVVISDLHCGHVYGLTPPDYHYAKGPVAKVQRTLWERFQQMVKPWMEPDLLLVNGDCVDGAGTKSAGTELISSDPQTQCDMAIECIEHIKPKRTIMTYGTTYHTGTADYERNVARAVGADIHSQAFFNVDGVCFSARHFIGASSIPHGRGTAIAKERLWNILWSDYGTQPKADVFLLSHVHYHSFIGGPGWLAMTTPALQGLGSKFGARICSGIVDFGITVFEVEEGKYTWQAITQPIKEQADKVARI